VTRSQIVHTFGSNFAVKGLLSSPHAAVRILRRFLCLLFFLGLGSGARAVADVLHRPATSYGPGLSVSIADFDGDLKPDLASVQAGSGDFARTDYWIQLQLSAAERQTFQIVAPTGGLQITSRDVNGDQALDLVLTTAWLRQPVAILLNNGHGIFSRVEPAVFPEAFSEPQSNWGSTTAPAIDAVGIPPQSREEICAETELFLQLRPQSRFAAGSQARFGIGPSLISHLGRAPPFAFPLF
jgi:hypothetical protein